MMACFTIDRHVTVLCLSNEHNTIMSSSSHFRARNPKPLSWTLIAFIASLVCLAFPGAAFGAQPSIVNVSGRFMLQPNGVFIYGTVLSGTQKVLIRAVGPGLAKFGVSNVNADPILEVYQGSTLVATVDDWEDQPVVNGKPLSDAPTVAAAATATGAFPLDSGSTDAATVLTLAPGAYTFHIRGAGGLAGDVLFEMYTVN